MTIGQGASKTRKLWIGSVKPNVSLKCFRLLFDSGTDVMELDWAS